MNKPKIFVRPIDGMFEFYFHQTGESDPINYFLDLDAFEVLQEQMRQARLSFEKQESSVVPIRLAQSE